MHSADKYLVNKALNRLTNSTLANLYKKVKKNFVKI